LAADVCCTDIRCAPGHSHGERTSRAATVVHGFFTRLAPSYMAECPGTNAH
jgi:hypothetical protein